jgi:hypothetical protein
VPYLVLAGWVGGTGSRDGGNAALDRHAANIRWGAGDLAFVHEMYPPLPTGFAGLLPGGPTALAVLGALGAGFVLHFLWQRLVESEVPGWATGPVLAGVAAAPAFALTAVHDLAAFASLALLMAAIAGVLAFAVDGDTGGGFRAGLALGVAAACGLAAVVYAGALGLAAPLIARHRFRGVRYSMRATVLVLLFPTVANVGGWALLEWRYTREVFHTVRADGGLFGFRAGPGPAVLDALSATGLAIAHTPLFLVAVAVLVLVRPVAALALALPVVGLLVTTLVGIPTTAEQNTVILALVAAMAIPPRPSRRVAGVFAVSSVLQLALAWL